MLFDHDAEIGAFLFLNMRANKIEGYLYRIDEIKQTEEKERTNEKTGAIEKFKEDVVIRKDYYVMDVEGNWIRTTDSTNPFLYHLQAFIEQGYAEDKAKLPWEITAGWIEDRFIQNTYVAHYVEYTPTFDQEKQPEKFLEELNKHKIDYELMQLSCNWVMESLKPNEAEMNDSKFDPVKKLLRELDKFEYNIGDKRT